jgi:Ca-activated chloride channel family protein
MKNVTRILTVLLLSLVFASAQSGVLIPSSIRDQPDEEVLSLQRMDVEILIDNQHANVKVRQIFANRTGQNLEGKYLFALPPPSSISDFAIWENDLRIPGVMMEKRRANAVYAELKAPQVDPAILQQDTDTAAFAAKVFPITPYGTKRLELEYTEDLAVENLISRFTFPLKPSFGESQTVGELNLRLRVISDFPISPLETRGYPLQVLRNEPNEYEAVFKARDTELKEDLSFAYRIAGSESSMSVTAYRAPEMISAGDLRDPKFANPNPDGYFESRAIFNREERQNDQPKKVILMLDTSLSMFGDKLLRAVEATDFFLRNLTETDEFNLILFNTDSISFSQKPIFATPENVEKALRFVKGEALEGGTNLKKALQTAIHQSKLLSPGDKNIVLISDANPTLETTKTKEIGKLLANEEVKLFAFALGVDANELLLRELTGKTHGEFMQARETDDLSLMLKIFFQKVGASKIRSLQLSSNDTSNFYDIYATEKESSVGSSVAFVGRYKQPKPVQVRISGQFRNEILQLTKDVKLPEFDDTHRFLPRVWARARVNALLQAMNRDGEREDYIAEIIRLSEKHKFVTPYTAFIAAPRALLRPRLIQPGDPVIRLKTDSSITRVLAVLPFGETLPLKFLADEGVWEVRFLAPATMADGTYRCRILMTDKDGNGYQEEKTFVVDARAPQPKIKLAKRSFRPGEEVLLKVSSDRDTAKLVAKFYGAKPVQLVWSPEHRSNVGQLVIPPNLATGKYILTITAEDFAHNLATVEIEVEVL